MMTQARKFRELLASDGLIRSLGAHDVFTAMLVEQSGLESVFLGGFGTAASMLGMPDVGQITLAEMADAARRMAARVRIPILADADTGHGDLQNVQRTVQLFEQAGVAGMIIEDQVTPKRCGHFEGKQLISTEEMVLKLNVVFDTRRDPDFVVVARTDAHSTEGLSGAIERANAYGEAGADVCFIEAQESAEELEEIPQQVPFPLLVNNLTGGVTPILSAAQLEQMGYKIALFPIAGLLAAGKAFQKVIQSLIAQGRVDSMQGEMLTFDEMKHVLGLPELMGLRSRMRRQV